MGARPQDRRPRVLDFSRKIDDVRASADLGWPCHAYRVTIPVRPVGYLNIFEDLVVRLLDGARLEEKQLREITGLDGSMLALVCSRLRDLGMITDRNELAAGGRSYLTEREQEELEYEIRIVFQERVSGAVLPTVLEGDRMRFEELIGWKQQEAELRQGDHRPLRLRLLAPARPLPPPTPTDVLRASRRHAELSYQYSFLRREATIPPRVVRAQQMKVDPAPENVFLRCRVVIPSVGGDYRIGDPFGFGFSETLLRAHEAIRAESKAEQEFIDELREAARTRRQRRAKENPRAREAENAVLARLDSAVVGFDRLFSRLRQAEKEIRTSELPPRTTDEEAHFRYYAQQAAQSLTEALESTLARLVATSRAGAAETLLSSRGQTSQDNAELLRRLAERLGFRTEDIGGLLQVVPGRVSALRQGGIDLQALVASCLASAIESPEHPLCVLAATFPGWLAFLAELKQMRDAGAHGQSRQAGLSKLTGLRDGIYRSIEDLLPALRRADIEAGPAPVRPNMDAAHDARRQAISRLEGYFGVRWYQRVSTDTAELFIQVELSTAALRKGTGTVDVVRLVNDLSSLLQTMAHTVAHRSDEARSPNEPPTAAAERRAREAGLLGSGATLPESLRRVNPKRLQQALQGRSPSLGATVLALLVLAPVEWLRGFSAVVPDLLALSAKLTDLRGHGNQPVLMTAADVQQLKNAVYAACEALLET